ncbi:MAG: ParA family protein, partial [Proteobacteria bacterium]|nr:ParA family protein [Pseudomonadota bacterium]
AQLAAAWAPKRRVALMDIDPQSSLSGWHAIRVAIIRPLPPIHLSDVSGWRVGTELDRLKNAYDVVLIDCPPHAETETKNAIRAASLVIVPVQPSPMDVWATAPTVDFATAQGAVIRIVLNRMPPRSRLVETVQAMLAEKDIPVSAASLGNRVAFAAAMMEGMGVTEYEPSGAAAQEVELLAAELARDIERNAA